MTNDLLNFNLSFKDLTQSFYYSSLNALPILIPVSLCLTLFFTYNKLSHYSEILAFKSLGFNLMQIAFPALLFGFLVFLASIPVSFYIAPWGHKNLEILIDQFKVEKKNLKIRPNIFVENIFNFVIYANHSNKQDQTLEEVFLYDETQSPWPLTIVAQKAKILQSMDKQFFLRLLNGSVHRTTQKTHTKMDFSSYDVYFPLKKENKDLLHPSSYNIKELKAKLNQPHFTSQKRKKRFEIAYYYLFNYPIAIFIFTIIGFSIGIFYIRPPKVHGMLICAVLSALYWILYSSFLNIGKNSSLSAFFSATLTNILFLIPVYLCLKRLRI